MPVESSLQEAIAQPHRCEKGLPGLPLLVSRQNSVGEEQQPGPKDGEANDSKRNIAAFNSSIAHNIKRVLQRPSVSNLLQHNVSSTI